MTAIEFQAFPKIARLNRNVTITEKIDGTNAAVVVVPLGEDNVYPVNPATGGPLSVAGVFDWDNELPEPSYEVFAQSRTRFITPENDNYGFARWVKANAEALVNILGAGRHYGEWWGAGIQRKYGLTGNDKRFSLFNTARWGHGDFEASAVPGLGVVPVLYEGPFDQGWINGAIDDLRENGSVAASGFMKPEGIVIYHEALRSSFKVTLEDDAAPKGASGHALDVEKVAA